jgi:phytoene desaturase
MSVYPQKQKKVIIIGAGVAGLASGIRLAGQGYSVTILEANGYAGGKLSEFQSGNYRFDAGPSLFTMPQLVEDLYRIAGKNPESFQYKKLEEVCRYFFTDGTRFTAPANPDQLGRIIEEELGEKMQTVTHYLTRSRLKYETIGSLFLERCLRKLSTFFNHRAFRAYLNLSQLGLFLSLDSYNKSVFRNPKTVQIFNRYATYNGSDPYQTSAVMSMIPHLEFGIGAYFPKEGMIQIANSLVNLAIESGVELVLNSPVRKLETNGKRITGVRTESRFYEADLVVSAIDVSQTYSRLLGMNGPGKVYLNLPKSTSAIIWYLGISKVTPETGLHNIFFSSDYRKEFEDLFQRKAMPSDPTIYLNISSKERKEDAPDKSENWFVMVNAPANEGQDWDRIIPETRAIVIRRLSEELGFDVESAIEEETVLEPRTLELRTGSVGGALYGSNSNSPFAAFLRHANYSTTFRNLFFCGGSVHPGGGIPLALQSAALATEYIRERYP